MIPLAVRAGPCPVEDVVGRHIDDMRTDERRSLRDVAGTDRVDGKGSIHLGLAPFDRGEGASVEHQLGPERGEGLQDGVPVVDAAWCRWRSPRPRD